jgi:hypothetical protein
LARGEPEPTAEHEADEAAGRGSEADPGAGQKSGPIQKFTAIHDSRIGRIPIDVTADVRMEPLQCSPLRAARCASQCPRRDRPALLLIYEKRSVSEGRSFELHHGAHHGRIRLHRGAGAVRAGAVRALESCSDVGGLELHHGAHHGRIRPHRGAGVVRAGAVRALESCSDVGVILLS